MSRNSLSFEKEPRDQDYRALVHAVGRMAAYILVVVRDELGLTDSGKGVVRQLEALGAVGVRRDSWPGTKLEGGQAQVYRVPVTVESLTAVAGAADGLYSWCQPELPEDLALVRIDESPLLASVAHEHDAWLELSAEEELQLEAIFLGRLGHLVKNLRRG